MLAGKSLILVLSCLIFTAAFSFLTLAQFELINDSRRHEIIHKQEMEDNDHVTYSVTDNNSGNSLENNLKENKHFDRMYLHNEERTIPETLVQERITSSETTSLRDISESDQIHGDQDIESRDSDASESRLPLNTLDYSNIHNSSSAAQFSPARKYEKSSSPKRKNVLFLVIDDFRPQFNHYRDFPNIFPDNDFKMHTPTMDALAKKSLVLSRAYVQYSSCNPSRASFMTSRRPDTTKVWNLHTFWRNSGGNFTTIPQFFSEKGYRTAGMGKIYHPGRGGGLNDPESWTDNYFIPPNGGYWSQKTTTADFWKTVTREEREEHPLPDEEITIRAVKRLREFAPKAITGEQQFFLGVGFLKPHLPIVFPEEFLSLYPLDELSMPKHIFMPEKYPASCWLPPLEVLRCTDINQTESYNMNVPFPADLTRVLRRAYFSGVSYIDYLLGILMDELQTLGLSDNTIVSFVGDHGWHLGEQGYWGKHTNFDLGLHTPMMMHIPGRTDGGLVSRSIVEFTDLFPTIVDAAGYGSLAPCPKISKDIALCTEGVSFLELIATPNASIHEFACSQHRFKGSGMGYTIRTDRYRYTETVNLMHTQRPTGEYQFEVKWDEAYGIELYDYELDPQETVNTISDPKYSTVRKTLREKLHQQFSATVTDLIQPFQS